jgi:hypothetical protein
VLPRLIADLAPSVNVDGPPTDSQTTFSDRLGTPTAPPGLFGGLPGRTGSVTPNADGEAVSTERVRQDVILGLVGVDAAREQYCVALGPAPEYEVDAEVTRALRAAARSNAISEDDR